MTSVSVRPPHVFFPLVSHMHLFLGEFCNNDIVDSLVVLIVSINAVPAALKCQMMVAFSAQRLLLLVDMSERKVEDNGEDTALTRLVSYKGETCVESNLQL